MRVKKTLLMFSLFLLPILFLGNILYAIQNDHENFCFLNTSWGQVGKEYAKYSPYHWRVGCWSIALAQILYYHRLEPHGLAAYNCSKGYVIKEDLNYKFNWELFVKKFDNNTPSDSKDEVAKYIYFASVVIQKDFGTDFYIEVNNPHWLDEHYDCSDSEYVILLIFH